MKPSIIDDLDKIVDITTKVSEIIKFQTKKPLQTIAIFDLADSTGLKLKIGHDETVKKIFLHNQICRQVVRRFRGHVIKEMGDGLLVRFEDPLDACLCAVNIQVATNKNNILSKTALTLGIVEEAKINNSIDIFGTTVDLCSRIEKCSFPNQVLMDRAMHDVVKSLLKDYSDIQVSDPMQIVLKGYGKSEIHEISSKEFPLINSLNNPYYINVDDGFSFGEKIKFIQNAKNEIVEIGIDTKDLGQNLDEYINHIKQLLEQGISFKLVILIPRLDVLGLDIPKTELEILNEMKDIKKLSDEFTKIKSNGKFELLLCQEMPLYHVVCIDRFGDDGTMIISNYLNGVKKEFCPVLHISKFSNLVIFKTYLESINHIIEKSIRQY